MYKNTLTGSSLHRLKNKLESFCLLLYTDYSADSRKKCKVAFTYRTNVESQVYAAHDTSVEYVNVQLL